MKPIDDIRRENLAALVAAEPSQAAFARKVGKDKNQVNQWLGRAGKRNVSAEIAREIELKTGKPRGWMDHEHSVAAAGDYSASHSSRQHLEILRAAMTLSDYLCEMQDGQPGDFDDSAEFMQFLFDLVAEEDKELDDSTLRYFSTKAMAKIREREQANGGERRAVEGNGDQVGGVSRKRARKA